MIHTEASPRGAKSPFAAQPSHGLAAAFNVQRLEKRYQGFTLGPVDLRLQPGTVLALIGPNGAGKTTLLDCLAGLIQPDAGSIRIFGQAAHGGGFAKGRIGYASDEGAYYENWSGARNLRFLAKFYPSWSESWLQELVRRFSFPLEKPVKTLSKGNRSKLGLITALAHKLSCSFWTSRPPASTRWREPRF
ncbi:MAG: ABC transporter ATP-binding protein [Deinococcota bacterium]|nr:ABC transporter ATP-binding protein [Deinococcota bacterium]